MAKKKKVAAPRPLTRKQRSRAERDARMNRWIIAATVVVGVSVVAVLVYGYLFEQVIKPGEPVAVVKGVPISTGDFQARVRFNRTLAALQLNQYQSWREELDPNDPEAAASLQQLESLIRRLQSDLSPENATTFAQDTLDEMIRDELVRQEAAQREMAVSQEELDRAIEQRFGYGTPTSQEPASGLSVFGPVTATETTTSTAMTREEFEQRYQDYIANVIEPGGLSEEDYRALVETELLYEQVYDALVEGIPSTMDQVQARYVAFPSEDQANEMLSRLEEGEAWEDIIADMQATGEDEGGGGGFAEVESGELDWRTRTLFDKLFGEDNTQIIWDTPVGSYTPPVFGISGQYFKYYVIQVTGHEERELDDAALTYEQEAVFQRWLSQQMEYVERSENWQEKVPEF